MKAMPTAITDVFILEPQVFGDSRGFFLESFNQKMFQEATGLAVSFVQDNHSRSTKGVLRGLHYQIHQPQGKLVRVVRGAVFDVAVDIRRSSPTFGQWVGVELAEDNNRQLWVPPGFAHGFYVSLILLVYTLFALVQLRLAVTCKILQVASSAVVLFNSYF